MLQACPLAGQHGASACAVAPATPRGFTLRANMGELPPSSRCWPLGRASLLPGPQPFQRPRRILRPCHLVLKFLPQRGAAGAEQGAEAGAQWPGVACCSALQKRALGRGRNALPSWSWGSGGNPPAPGAGCQGAGWGRGWPGARLSVS